MNDRRAGKGRGEAVRIAATAAVVVVLLASFGAYSLVSTGDLLAFFAGLPLTLCTAGVLSGWMSLIRMDYGEEDAKRREVGSARQASEEPRAPAATLGHGLRT
jgi:hypothetical protein